MAGSRDFRELMQRVRAGDADAATELVRRYEPIVRRIIRVRLSDPGLRRALDSVDICQSVLANFFTQVGRGDVRIETPGQLVNLLAAMAKNRLYDHVRHEHAERRDQRRVISGEGLWHAQAATEPTPSRVAAGKELLEQLRGQLGEEEYYLAEQRAQGREWSDLAAELGVDQNALRMRLRRALQRVAEELKLEASERNG